MKARINKAVIADTMKRCSTSQELTSSIEYSLKNRILFDDSTLIKRQADIMIRDLDVTVSNSATLDAAQKWVEAGKRTAVLNFCNAYFPGGGALNGASAQEEYLCRLSTLFPILSKIQKEEWNERVENTFYTKHIKEANLDRVNVYYTKDVIYTPDVVVLKKQTGPINFEDLTNPFKVDVLTAAAPNLYEGKMKRTDQSRFFHSIWNKIFDIANQLNIEVLILGAFGCGAFGNDPEIVSKELKRALDREKSYKGSVTDVEIAIIDNDKSNNYKTFLEVFEEK